MAGLSFESARVTISPEISDDIDTSLDELKITPFTELEARMGYAFAEVRKAGPNDPRYMSYDRFLASPRTAADVRAFLHFSVHLRELFGGDVYTYDENGERGVEEFCVPTLPLSQRGHLAVRDIDVV